MTDDNNDTATEPAKTRGRPVGAKTKRARRNYASDLAELQGRVALAVRLLRKCKAAPDAPAFDSLVEVAISTLTGEE